MIIANPIYDVVFKKLMEDERIAKFFIGTLIDETIEEVQVRPQEFTYTDQLAGLAVFRLDFIATIKTAACEYKKVLIEIQKAKNMVDLMRFRNYLGEQYKKEDEIITATGTKKVALPIITIYLLGFQLPDVMAAAVKINRQYIDLLTQQVISVKSEFIEKLTHDCYVVQLPRIEGRLQSKLEKLLSLFEQRFFVDDRSMIKEYKYAIDDETIQKMVNVLHYAGTDPREKKQLEDEQEAYRVLDVMMNPLREEFMKTKQELEQSKQEIEQSKQEIEQSKQEIEQSKQEIEQSKQEIEQSKQVIEQSKQVIEQSKQVIEQSKQELENQNKAIEEKDKMIEELKRRLGEQ